VIYDVHDVDIFCPWQLLEVVGSLHPVTFSTVSSTTILYENIGLLGFGRLWLITWELLGLD
jgi:hypothetical protein